ncbi:hypothetical protein ABMA28_009566 [Loxostege sticticalis]|uniref:Hexosyltransferase n=1 Tax=Loxostege sticticalis TaxID=481309 RepID=A0ABD0SFW3_LOXSC
MLSRFVVSQVKHNSYFLVGVVIGLWVALAAIPLEEEVVTCAEASTAALSDEFEPQREDRPLGPAGQAAGRSVQRPRYYSTELGIRGPLLAGVLSSEDALDSRVAALNQTAARLQPALRVFIAASALQAAPGRANVVGFTDTREMLKPFHALKYLADNYLEEYNFFFLVSDTSFVNARRLQELVLKLSISQDVYMGTIAEDDSHYCTLEGGILLSNSVLRAVHGELDWCVRNSYSPHHHENIGRCVLHAAHQHCTPALQSEQYSSLRLGSDGELAPALADAVTAHPVTEPAHFYRLHAYVSRVFLERDAAEISRLRALLVHTAARHPRGFRNATWPAGLRTDPGLAAPPPDTRFDHLRWTLFNESHAFMPDDHHAVGPITGATKEALELVLRTARAWSLNRWTEAEDIHLLEGAWRWDPPYALRYRLLLRLTPKGTQQAALPSIRSVEVVRGLGAARLVAAPYVTESARLTLLLPVDGKRGLNDLRLFLRRYEAICLMQDKNTALIVVVVRTLGEDESSLEAAREAVNILAGKHRNAQLDVLSAAVPAPTYMPDYAWTERLQKVALNMALPRVPKDTLILLSVPHMEFNQDFLNRVRMNTIPGWQWYWAVGFARHAQYSHPRFRDASGARPQQHTGRFNQKHRHTAAFYRRDFDAAMAAWTGSKDASIVDILTNSPLRCLRAPDPALVLVPRAPPCRLADNTTLTTAPGFDSQACLRAHSKDHFEHLDLGDRHALAKLLLEERARVQ